MAGFYVDCNIALKWVKGNGKSKVPKSVALEQLLIKCSKTYCMSNILRAVLSKTMRILKLLDLRIEYN